MKWLSGTTYGEIGGSFTLGLVSSYAYNTLKTVLAGLPAKECHRLSREKALNTAGGYAIWSLTTALISPKSGRPLTNLCTSVAANTLLSWRKGLHQAFRESLITSAVTTLVESGIGILSEPAPATPRCQFYDRTRSSRAN